MPIIEIPWVIEEHTIVKHELLKNYIEPWMAIFFKVQRRHGRPQIVIYFDGFCGPGTYYTDRTKQQECCGSPLIVADVANRYIDEDKTRSVVMHCIDKHARCVELLTQKLKGVNKHSQDWNVHLADFDERIEEVLCDIDSSQLGVQPMFFFLDPFGYSGYSMRQLKRILKYPRAELFINFMVYDIVRFCEDRQFEENMIALFGCDDFKQVAECATSEQKYAFFVNLYSRALYSTGADYVMPFRVNTPSQGTRPRYYLIHASKDRLALRVMKDNMAKQSDSPYRFEAVGIATHQMSLFENPDKLLLRERILAFIRYNRSKKLLFEDVETWAYENTNGVSRTIKEALRILENDGAVTIERKPRQRKNTVTNGAYIIATE